jgi:ABC-type phosphate transport system substrate-binding protein
MFALQPSWAAGHCWVALLGILVGLTLLTPTTASAQSGFVVVAHPDVPVSSIDMDMASKIFLQKERRWSDGTTIHPVTLAVSEVREEFAQVVHHRSELDLRKHWQRQIFTGRGSPPLERPNDAAVLEYVRSTPGAIGYISPGARANGVKVIQLR